MNNDQTTPIARIEAPDIIEPATKSAGDMRRSATERALAEASARRLAARDVEPPVEQNGRGGLDPTRYGDWEVKGLTSDF